MTQEEKQFLLQDLCARLSYGVKCTTKLTCYNDVYFVKGVYEDNIYIDCPIYEEGDDFWMIESIVPYLRPMSSMTEEEEEELKILTDNKFSLRFDGKKIINLPILEIDDGWHCGSLTSRVDSFDIINLIDWLNAHHFDYRGLIEKGLALEASEGMYKN